MFAKRHYEFLAKLCVELTELGTVGVTGESVPRETFSQTVARCLATKLAADNPKFDRARFLKACAKK